MSGRYYYRGLDGREIGPVSESALRHLASTGLIVETTLVRASDEKVWRTFDEMGLQPFEPELVASEPRVDKYGFVIQGATVRPKSRGDGGTIPSPNSGHVKSATRPIAFVAALVLAVAAGVYWTATQTEALPGVRGPLAVVLGQPSMTCEVYQGSPCPFLRNSDLKTLATGNWSITWNLSQSLEHSLSVLRDGSLEKERKAFLDNGEEIVGNFLPPLKSQLLNGDECLLTKYYTDPPSPLVDATQIEGFCIASRELIAGDDPAMSSEVGMKISGRLGTGGSDYKIRVGELYYLSISNVSNDYVLGFRAKIISVAQASTRESDPARDISTTPSEVSVVEDPLISTNVLSGRWEYADARTQASDEGISLCFEADQSTAEQYPFLVRLGEICVTNPKEGSVLLGIDNQSVADECALRASGLASVELANIKQMPPDEMNAERLEAELVRVLTVSVGKGPSVECGEGLKEEVSATPLSMRPPRYPAVLERRGVTGTTTLVVTVGIDGSVVDAVVDVPSGHEEFDDEAIRASRSWRYRPATKDGKPVESQIRVPVEFALR